MSRLPNLPVTHHPYLFVYGTLQSVFRRNPHARELRADAILLGRARIPGRLYALRRYPCLRPPLVPGDWVTGELYRLKRPGPLLDRLDAYEAGAYRRVLRSVALKEPVTDPPGPIRAWTYLFTQPLPSHRKIVTGTWPCTPLDHLVLGQRPSLAQ